MPSAPAAPSAAELARQHKLVDLEWSFGVRASSSEHAVIGSTYTHVRLAVRAPSGALDYVHFELNLEEFYEFLHELERARAQLELV